MSIRAVGRIESCMSVHVDKKRDRHTSAISSGSDTPVGAGGRIGSSVGVQPGGCIPPRTVGRSPVEVAVGWSWWKER